MERVVFFLPSVNSTPTNTARTELHSMITFHHANTRGSRAAKLRIAHLCVPKTIVIHVSCLIPCRTMHLSLSLTNTQDLWPSTHKNPAVVPWQSGGSTQIPSLTPSANPCACLSRVGGVCEEPLRLEVLKDFSASRHERVGS